MLECVWIPRSAQALGNIPVLTLTERQKFIGAQVFRTFIPAITMDQEIISVEHPVSILFEIKGLFFIEMQRWVPLDHTGVNLRVQDGRSPGRSSLSACGRQDATPQHTQLPVGLRGLGPGETGQTPAVRLVVFHCVKAKALTTMEREFVILIS